MFEQSRLFTLLIMSLVVIVATTLAFAQAPPGEPRQVKGKNDGAAKQVPVRIEIVDVIIKDDEAKESPDSRSRHTGGINFKSVSTGAAKLVQAEVTLETLNNDGTKSRASKRIKDGPSNTLLEETIDLPMAKGVFPHSYTVTIKGKCDPGNGAAWVDVSAVKKGGFTPPDPGVGPRKK